MPPPTEAPQPPATPVATTIPGPVPAPAQHRRGARQQVGGEERVQGAGEARLVGGPRGRHAAVVHVCGAPGARDHEEVGVHGAHTHAGEGSGRGRGGVGEGSGRGRGGVGEGSGRG